MDRLCVRCARHSLRALPSCTRGSPALLVRHLSQSAPKQAGSIDLSQPIPGGPDASSKSSDSKPKSIIRQTRSDPPARQKPGNVLIRKTPTSSPPAGVLTRSPRPTGPRHGSAERGSAPPTVLRRAGGDRPPFVRRTTGPPGQRGPNQRNNQRQGGQRRGRGPREGPDNVFDEYADDDDARSMMKQQEEAFEAHQAEVERLESNNGLSTKDTPYSPADQTIVDLQQDWPGTPLSATGLTENVLQKLNHLARSLNHDYWTPRQIAERFFEGELVRFTSEEQKVKVMQYAAEIARERETMLKEKAERKGKEMPPPAEQNWAVKSLADQSTDRQTLIDTMVRGVYPDLPKGQRPLYMSIQRQLRNNETYVAADKDKLMGRIETLIAGIQRQSAAQKESAAKQ